MLSIYEELINEKEIEINIIDENIMKNDLK